MELFVENPEKDIRLPLKIEENSDYSQDCNMLKIVFLEAGRGVLSIDGRGIAASAPAIICLNGLEGFMVISSEALNTRILYFSPSVVNSAFNIENIWEDANDLPETAKLDQYYFSPFLRREGQTADVIKPELLTAVRITATFDALKMQMSNFGDDYWPCRNRSYLIELLFVIQHCHSGQQALDKSPYADNSNISEIILFLNLNYDQKIMIDELSRQFHTNRNSLNKNFRKATGQTVFGYLIKARIDAACRLLRDTKLPVSEIAERIGFLDLSYWGRAFKSQTGLTPSDYRKLGRGDGSGGQICKVEPINMTIRCHI